MWGSIYIESQIYLLQEFLLTYHILLNTVLMEVESEMCDQIWNKISTFSLSGRFLHEFPAKLDLFLFYLKQYQLQKTNLVFEMQWKKVCKLWKREITSINFDNTNNFIQIKYSVRRGLYSRISLVDKCSTLKVRN